jgi:hypothetical protein
LLPEGEVRLISVEGRFDRPAEENARFADPESRDGWTAARSPQPFGLRIACAGYSVGVGAGEAARRATPEPRSERKRRHGRPERGRRALGGVPAEPRGASSTFHFGASQVAVVPCGRR